MHTVKIAIAALLLSGSALGVDKPSPETQRALDDVKQTLGIVPQFLKDFPPAGLPAAWQTVKALEFGKTNIPDKYKSLIGIAVSSQIPCRYCTIFDTEGAKLGGATLAEINEAVALAGIVRQWSAVINGIKMDDATFAAEVKQVMDYVKANANAQAPAALALDAKPEAVLADVKQTLGIVPTFIKSYPEAGLAGAWSEMKAIQLNPKSAIPGKYKELIGLAVASQIPCKFCVVFHSEAIALNGGTEPEAREAVALAGLTRHWSAWFYGTQQDETAFRKDVAKIMAHLRKQTSH